MQAAAGPSVFDLLRSQLSVGYECFASPLNAHFSRFGSAFPDVDAPFGSGGSFFRWVVILGLLGAGRGVDNEGWMLLRCICTTHQGTRCQAGSRGRGSLGVLLSAGGQSGASFVMCMQSHGLQSWFNVSHQWGDAPHLCTTPPHPTPPHPTPPHPTPPHFTPP